jgi:hypothetical protein
MNIREPTSSRSYLNRLDNKPPKTRHTKKYFLVLVIFAISLVSWSFLGTSHASTVGSPLKSGWNNYCLDDYKDKTIANNQVDIWPCNNSEAQDWELSLTQIKHGDSQCLTAESDSTIDLNDCTQAANQVWLRDGGGYLNPNSGLCLSSPKEGQGQLLTLDSCDNLTSSTQNWIPSFSYSDYKCTGDQASQVACSAVKEWINWQSNPNGHEALLNTYTGGTPYEEWCADFVSYIFKESGFPFTNGNYGWDENIASGIQNQGFTMHTNPDYVPVAGDVAFFDYPGGHVEIVVRR